MDNRAAKNKSMAFAIRMVKLYRYLSEEKKEFIISKQLLRISFLYADANEIRKILSSTTKTVNEQK